MTERLNVPLGDGRDYPVILGEGCLEDPAHFDPFIGSQAMVVTNPAVAGHCLDRLRQGLANVAQLDILEIGDGERFKTVATWASVLDRLVERRHNRTTTLVALGGGVVGDVAGFAAASYQRGVGLIQVPTTLLAQVDSSVGGKTAVNHPAGKNLIGAFYQPRTVVADMGVLRTLPEREFRAGLAEVIKYGVIADAGFFAWLERRMDDLVARQPDALIRAVRRSCEIKAQVVAGDEREQAGRAILNFGHTYGHALEALTNYQTFLHGEAVAMGMVMAMNLSERTQRAPAGETERVRNLLAQAGLPIAPAELDPDAMLQAMGMDKKVVDGRIRLVLCHGIGQVSVTAEVPPTDIRTGLQEAS